MNERKLHDPDRRCHDIESPCGRREHCAIHDEEIIEKIAEKAAEKAIEKMTSSIYQEIGKSVVSKVVYTVGTLLVAAWIYLKTKGAI